MRNILRIKNFTIFKIFLKRIKNSLKKKKKYFKLKRKNCKKKKKKS